MPKELPGFYYDAEKNRYFPYKGPIPGSSVKPPPKPPPSDTEQADRICHTTKIGQEKLLRARELCGNVISSRRGKISFQAECENRHASKPMIWRYEGTKKMANIALEHVVADVALPNGVMERDILMSGGANGLLCLSQAVKTRQEIDQTQIYKADLAWPPNLDQIPRHKELLKQLGSSFGDPFYTTSDVSCIKASRRRSQPTDDAMSKLFIITTLGSESAPGAVCLLDLSKPLDFNARARGGFFELAVFQHTLWTTDCDPEGRRAAIGTNRGVALLNMETGTSSWVLRCKSDVLSLQHQCRNNILCGLRNGAILTVDTRQKQIRRSRNSSSTLSMPSSVCCLEPLKHSDQYFLASSMDGSIKLYDSRLIQRGPVQSYEGNVNSHTRIQLGVDPSEKVVMSGGEDCYLRLWNITSGELLFKEKFMNSIPSVVCWPRTGAHVELGKECQDYRCYWQDQSMGAWIGSFEGIFYMDWL